MDNISSDLENSEENINELLKIRRQKLKALQEHGKDPFKIVKYDVDTKSIDVINNFEAFEGKDISIAGRIITRRLMGKASFCDILDGQGRIQVYLRKNELGEDLYEEFKKYDIGDIIGVKGEVFKTQKGEISIKSKSITLLTKSLQVLPEKFHGLKDQDLKYRQRYIDLIINEDVRSAFIKRSAVIKSIRNFLDNREYMEVETPVLQTITGGAAARPFATYHNSLGLDMYMRISLEPYLKRLIVGGFERVYEIGRVFRNEGISTKHNPEFTLLELYEAYTDYHGMMDLTEELIKTVVQDINGSLIVESGEHKIDVSGSFERITMLGAVKKYANVDFSKIELLEEARKVADKHHIKYESHHGKGDILNLFFEKYVEDKLIQPTFILDHPVEISPLTKRKPNNHDYTERFELFILGKEFANAYSELNDPIDQRIRFEHQEALRAAGDEEANPIDEDFILSLEYGMPPTGGLGIGIDRLVMFITSSNSIRDVILFPTMKPIN